MRTEVKWLARGCVSVTLLLLGGCMYDPYVGGWVPCCTYGYGYGYRYPPPYYGPYGYPYGAPGPQPGYAPDMQQGYPSAPASAAPANGGGLAQRFAAANVTHDGRLTREQAEQGMPFVARDFDAIDFDRKGYVTLPEIRAFAAQRRAAGGGPPGPSGMEE